MNDEITLRFLTSEAVLLPSNLMLINQYNLSASQSVSNNLSYSINRVVSDIALDGQYAIFSIFVIDLAGNVGNIVSSTTDNSSLLFDFIPPLVLLMNITSNNVFNPLFPVTGSKVTITAMFSETLFSMNNENGSSNNTKPGIEAKIAFFNADISSMKVGPLNLYEISRVFSGEETEGIVQNEIIVRDQAGNENKFTNMTDMSYVIYGIIDSRFFFKKKKKKINSHLN